MNNNYLAPIRGHSFLVTGGAGFIGGHLVDALLAADAGRVIILDNFATGYRQNIAEALQDERCSLIEGDIRDGAVCMEACAGVDYVLHQAALGSIPRSMAQPLATHEANVTGFVNILWAAKTQGVRRVVYASSSSVYGNSPLLPRREQALGQVLSPYALSKLVNEQYAQVFALAYGMELIGLRYFNVFGARQNPHGAYAAVIPLFIKALLRGEQATIYGDGSQTRDFTYIDNVVQANLRALFVSDAEACGKAYNIGCGTRTSVLALYKTIQRLMEASQEVAHAPKRAGDVSDSLADISLARTYLGYEPSVSLEEGLQTTIGWYRQHIDQTPSYRL
ncbi:SDR family oxidoreductase [Eisenibacter elegans]|uniref:SDR family oxidoreductase n=1 Tax=Eisenibacter elegans TaxID=997 RepID=UPI0004176EEE|nr:SDR family oxidoreductase [Eisenibacter elegans]